MAEVIGFLLLGLGSGALISGVGMGIVLSYRGAGVINLGVGAFAMLSGFFYWAMRSGFFKVTVSTVPAIILTLLFSMLLGVFFEFAFIRPLRRQSPLARMVATLGFLLGAPALVLIIFGTAARPQPPILTSSTVILSGVPIGYNRIIMVCVLLVLALAFTALYRWTKFGVGTRAAAENETNALLMGMSPNWISLVNNVLMAVMMGLVGLLAASIAEVDSSTLPLIVVPALAAAMVGKLTSFTTTLITGMLLGMGESLLVLASTKSWYPTNGGVGNPLPGVQDLLILVVLMVAMYFRAGKIPSRGDIVERRLPPAPRPKAPLSSAMKFGIPAAICMWAFPYGYREALIASLIAAVLMLSLTVLTGFLGQVSVMQVALGGIAGFSVSHFATNFGIGFPWGPILGVLCAVIFGLLTGFPALRVRGVSLVVVTLAAAVAVENFGFANTTWGAGAEGAYVPTSSLFGFNFGPNASFPAIGGAEPSPLFGWFVLLVAAAVGLWVCNLRRSTLGQEMLAIRANERAAAASGINVRNTKLVAFAIASGIAGISGALLAYNYGSITADSYSTTIALSLISFGYIAGITTVPGAFQAGLLFTGGLNAYALMTWFGLQSNWIALVGGAGLVLTLVARPDGIATYAFYGEKKPFREGRLGRLILRNHSGSGSFGQPRPALAGESSAEPSVTS